MMNKKEKRTRTRTSSPQDCSDYTTNYVRTTLIIYK